MGRRGLLAVGLLSLLSPIRACARKPKPRVFSDVAELRDYVMAALRKQPGVERVVPVAGDPTQFEVVAGDNSSTGNVTNLFNYLVGNPDEDAEWIVGRFINTFAEGREPKVEDKDIVATIRTDAYVRSMSPTALHEPYGADLVILYMADRPDSMGSFGSDAVQGRGAAAIRPIAVENVKRWLPKVVRDDSLGDGSLFFVEDNPMLSPSLLLVDDFWKSVQDRFPGDVLIALPRKDQLFLFDDDGKVETRAGVRRLIDATMAEGYNLLSPLLYARRGGKIVLVRD